MSYRKIDQIPKAERLVWTPERGGRTRQKVAGTWVSKFSYSPFTAKSRKEYTFYADVEIRTEVEYAGKKLKHATVVLITGTYLEFRDFVVSGEAGQRIMDVVGVYGVEEVTNVAYWRNKGKQDDS